MNRLDSPWRFWGCFSWRAEENKEIMGTHSWCRQGGKAIGRGCLPWRIALCLPFQRRAMAFQTDGYLNEDGKFFLNVNASFYAWFRLRIMGFICSIYTVFYSVSFSWEESSNKYRERIEKDFSVRHMYSWGQSHKDPHRLKWSIQNSSQCRVIHV